MLGRALWVAGCCCHSVGNSRRLERGCSFSLPPANVPSHPVGNHTEGVSLCPACISSRLSHCQEVPFPSESLVRGKLWSTDNVSLPLAQPVAAGLAVSVAAGSYRNGGDGSAEALLGMTILMPSFCQCRAMAALSLPGQERIGQAHSQAPSRAG